MTGKDLRDALRETGTGERKLAVLDRALEQNRNLDGEQALRALAQAGVGEGVVDKAQRLLQGAPVSAFQGAPPPNGQESRQRRMLEEYSERIAGAFADRLAEGRSKRGV